MGLTTYLLSLSVTPQDEWRLHDLSEGKPDGLNNPERELIQQFPEVWAKDIHPPPPLPPAPARACQTLSSSGKRTQTWCHTSQEMSVPVTTGGTSWYLSIYKYATAGGHHD